MTQISRKVLYNKGHFYFAIFTTIISEYYIICMIYFFLSMAATWATLRKNNLKDKQ